VRSENGSADAQDALPISVTRPLTKYETKAQDAGSAVAELVWEKR
jgi:tRNA (guanine-N7-)-methyltransferase